MTYRRIFIFWVPLAGTWLMMAVEGPFLAAIIARLADPTENLAAYGVALAVALLVESPVIMLLSAATALVTDRASYLALRRFTQTLNVGITAVMAILLVPPVFNVLAYGLLNLPADVATLTYGAIALLLPWPWAIGYRRFLQGTLVRHNMTRRVAYGTMIRVVFMAITAAVGSRVLEMRGAHVGALALTVGVLAEAIASRLMAARIVRELLSGQRDKEGAHPLAQPEIASFYFPLVTMSVLAMGVHPMVTFFMGRSHMALESLAVLPVIHGLGFLFRSLGLSYQEVTIALSGDHGEHFDKLRNFAIGLGVAVSAGITIIVFTPAATFWFETVSGLTPALAEFARLPAQITALLPALTVLMSFQRGLLVGARNTGPLTTATIIEVGGIALIMSVAILGLNVVGVVAAMAALVVGRIAGNICLMAPCIDSLRQLRAPH